jgi:hypothetical protein
VSQWSERRRTGLLVGANIQSTDVAGVINKSNAGWDLSLTSLAAN